MVRLFFAMLVHLVANAIALIVAAAVLDDMTLDASGFLVAVVIFTVVEALMQPFVARQALNRSNALLGSSALIAALVALVVTTIVSDGLTIDGALTWVVATVVVWAAALLATWLLPLFVFKRAVDNRRD